jgi:hypothetical protein
LIVGAGLWLLIILLTGFGAAMSSDAKGIVDALGTIAGAFVGGAFVLAAALIAWRSVQVQIGAQERAEKIKQEADAGNLKSALTAELLAFAPPVIKGTSIWNERAHNNPDSIPPHWQMIAKPLVYNAILSEIGLLDGTVAAPVILFYGNVLTLNEVSQAGKRGEPLEETNGTFAKRFQIMAHRLADSLDSLNDGHQFPNKEENTHALIKPTGDAIGSFAAPKSLQELLRTLGGSAAKSVQYWPPCEQIQFCKHVPPAPSDQHAQAFSVVKFALARVGFVVTDSASVIDPVPGARAEKRIRGPRTKATKGMGRRLATTAVAP